MSLFRPTGQFDDADDEAAAVAEQNLAGDIAHATAAASRLAASRAAAMSFAPGSAMVRAAAERTANSGAASYLSLLQSASHGADSGSPYFQRQSYRPTYMNAQSPYGGISSAEATLAFARHNYPYGATPGLSSDNGGQGFPGGYSSPHAARDFATYYQRQAQDLSSAALLDRAYQMQESNQQVIPGQALSASALQYLSKGQSTVKSSPDLRLQRKLRCQPRKKKETRKLTSLANDGTQDVSRWGYLKTSIGYRSCKFTCGQTSQRRLAPLKPTLQRRCMDETSRSPWVK